MLGIRDLRVKNYFIHATPTISILTAIAASALAIYAIVFLTKNNQWNNSAKSLGWMSTIPLAILLDIIALRQINQYCKKPTPSHIHASDAQSTPVPSNAHSTPAREPILPAVVEPQGSSPLNPQALHNPSGEVPPPSVASDPALSQPLNPSKQVAPRPILCEKSKLLKPKVAQDPRSNAANQAAPVALPSPSDQPANQTAVPVAPRPNSLCERSALLDRFDPKHRTPNAPAQHAPIAPRPNPSASVANTRRPPLPYCPSHVSPRANDQELLTPPQSISHSSAAGQPASVPVASGPTPSEEPIISNQTERDLFEFDNDEHYPQATETRQGELLKGAQEIALGHFLERRQALRKSLEKEFCLHVCKLFKKPRKISFQQLKREFEVKKAQFEGAQRQLPHIALIPLQNPLFNLDEREFEYFLANYNAIVEPLDTLILWRHEYENLFIKKENQDSVIRALFDLDDFLNKSIVQETVLPLLAEKFTEILEILDTKLDRINNLEPYKGEQFILYCQEFSYKQYINFLLGSIHKKLGINTPFESI